MKSNTIISSPRTRGSTLLVAALTTAILTIIAGSVLFEVSRKYRTLTQGTSWRKALIAAESGVDFALQALTVNITDPGNAWTDWSTTDPHTGETLPHNGKGYTGVALEHGGEGGNSMNFSVVVDTPPGLAPTKRTKQYYRIRSTGYEDISGRVVVSDTTLDVALRKLSLRWDRRTGEAVATPHASRLIEVIAEPETDVMARNVAHLKWEFDSYKNETRAFDSRSDLYSTDGKWDMTKQVPADEAGILLATNQWHKDNIKKGKFEKVDLKHSSIWGDFMAVVGPIKNGEHVKGETLLGSSTDLPKVLPPTWTTLTDPSLDKYEGSLSSDQKLEFQNWKSTASQAMKDFVNHQDTGLVLYGGSSPSTPTTYKMTKVKIDKKDKSLVLANPPGVSESWIEIWTTEEFRIKDGGTLAVENGVHATIHFEKKFKVKDTKKDLGGTFVESGYAGDLVVYGIEIPESSKETDDDFSAVKTSGKAKIKDSQFTGVLFAPDYDMELKTRNSSYPNSQQYILGAVTGRKVKFKGATDFITDLALTQSGKEIVGYRVASWFEDSE